MDHGPIPNISEGKGTKTPRYVNLLFFRNEIFYLCLFIFVFSACDKEPGISVPTSNVPSKTLFFLTATKPFGHSW